MIPEARAIFDSTHPADLGKGALYAYADISFKDGNLSLAFHLLRLADEKDGFVTAFAGLRKEIERCMLAEAESVFPKAAAAFERGAIADASMLVHEALRHYPNFVPARELAASIEAMKAAADIDRLWDSYRLSTISEERLDALAGLLERDKGNREKVKSLISDEKIRQKNDLVENRLSTLGVCAEQGKWSECFDTIQRLARQEEHQEHYRKAVSFSPLFSVLHQNKRLERLPQQSAKDIWLSFIEAKSRLRLGRDRKCFDIMQKIRPFFRSYPQFSEEYDTLLATEQTRAAEEISHLLAQARADSCTLPEATAIFATLRRRMAALPPEERARHNRYMEERLQQLLPRKGDDTLLEEYREALMLGSETRALLLREGIADAKALAAIDAEIKDLFTIHAEPVTVSLSETMEVDRKRGNPPLGRGDSTDRHVILNVEVNIIILLDLHDMTANRLSSPVFEKLCLYDAIPDRHEFLFREESTGNRFWRAILSASENRFTSTFELAPEVWPGENIEVGEVFLSSSRDNEFYCHLAAGEDKKKHRLEKVQIGTKISAVKRYDLNGQVLKEMLKASSAPDKFLMTTDSHLTMVTNNLGCSVTIPESTTLFGVDKRDRLIYLAHNVRLSLVTFELRQQKILWDSFTISFYSHGSTLGICPETETAQIALDGSVGIFYNLTNNKFSNQFDLNSIICTRVPSRWYYLEYEQDSGAIKLKDITHRLDDIFEWAALSVRRACRSCSRSSATRSL